MQNDEQKIVDLYIPRKCSATNRLITAKDSASVQIDIADVPLILLNWNIGWREWKDHWKEEDHRPCWFHEIQRWGWCLHQPPPCWHGPPQLQTLISQSSLAWYLAAALVAVLKLPPLTMLIKPIYLSILFQFFFNLYILRFLPSYLI